jgi:hypothetical protein
MNAFDGGRRIQSFVLGKPEKSRTLDHKKRAEPFSAPKRRMPNGVQQASWGRVIVFKWLRFCT